MIDLTPALHQEAINVSKGYLTGTIYTPPAVEGEDGVRGSLQPMTGGASWLGGAFDPEAGRLFVPSYTRTIWAGIVAGDPAATNLRYVRRHRTPMVGPQGLPLTKPPFGRITALDLKTGNTQWIVANGEGPRNHPALKGLNVPRLGYGTYVMPLATKTLLFGAQADKASYVGRTPDGTIPLADYFEDKLVAYNKNDGSVAGSIKLPAGAAGSILTYMYLGKQYIVVPTGSFQKPAEFVALSLP
jgi:quinoprotein glucose dehydrogenase